MARARQTRRFRTGRPARQGRRGARPGPNQVGAITNGQDRRRGNDSNPEISWLPRKVMEAIRRAPPRSAYGTRRCPAAMPTHTLRRCKGSMDGRKEGGWPHLALRGRCRRCLAAYPTTVRQRLRPAAPAWQDALVSDRGSQDRPGNSNSLTVRRGVTGRRLGGGGAASKEDALHRHRATQCIVERRRTREQVSRGPITIPIIQAA